MDGLRKKSLILLLGLALLASPGCRKAPRESRPPGAGGLEPFLIKSSELTLKFVRPPAARRLSFRNSRLPPEEWKVRVRAKLAELPGRCSPKLSPTTINKAMGLLRQCLTEASERFGTPDPFKGVKRLKGRRPDVKPFSLDEIEQIRTHRANHAEAWLLFLDTGIALGGFLWLVLPQYQRIRQAIAEAALDRDWS